MSSAEPPATTDHAFELARRPEDGWRVATLVYREPGRALFVELERSAARNAGWLALDSDFCVWSEPFGRAVEPEHTDRILARLADWSASSGEHVEVGPGVDPLVELMARGFTLARNADGSVTATPPPSRVRGFLTSLFRR